MVLSPINITEPSEESAAEYPAIPVSADGTVQEKDGAALEAGMKMTEVATTITAAKTLLIRFPAIPEV